MTEPTTYRLDRRGNRWIGAGGAFGLAGGVLAVVLPLLLVEISRHAPGGIAAASSSLVAWTSWFLLAGAVLLLLSFFAYRWGYSVLRKAEPTYWVASALCIVGSSGFLLLIIAAAVATGSENGLLACVQGPYSQIYSCVQGQTPLGAYTAVAGLWLAWIGSVGIVLGLFQAGGRYLSGLYVGAGACYLITLVLLVGPLTGIFVSVAFIEPLLLMAPVFVVTGPLLVLLARPTYPRAPAAPATPPPAT